MSVTGEVPVGQRPRGILLSPDGKTLYILASDDDHVEVMDTATLKVTEPMPDPVAPAVTVIHGVVVVAVHEQDVPEVTLSVRLEAIASTSKPGGVTVAWQPAAD